MAEIKSFPNNQDEYIGAEDVMRWLHGRTSGVFGAEGNVAVRPVLDAMAVTVSDGSGWMSNDNSDGIVWWIDNESKTGEKMRLSIDMADAVLPRIDRVVVSWDTTNYVALPEVSILKGTSASAPVAPALTNNNLLRQISLASIFIPAGSTSVSADMVTDERLNPDVCGIVTESVSVDTSMANAQFMALLERIEDSMEDILGGQIADGSVTNEKLADGSVTAEKLSDIKAEDVGARPDTWMPTPAEVGAYPAKESIEHPGCYYRLYDGVTEWINPPLEIGVEYRTVRRYTGRPVYIKRIRLGNLASSGYKYVEHGVEHGSMNILNCKSIAYSEDDTCVFPIYVNGILAAYYYINNTQIGVNSIGSVSGYTAHFEIEYVK